MTPGASGPEERTRRLAEALGAHAPPQLLRETAFETIKDAIIEGRLPPGSRLIERELCAALGVSRAIVREVVRRLEAERLVEGAAHRGPRVAVITPKTAREIYALREELEALLMREFVATASDADVRALAALSGEVAAAAASRDVPGLVDIMRRFYATLTRGAGNATAADMLETLHARISRLRVLSMGEPGRIEASVGEIAAIAAAVAARDATGAEAATRAYVREAGAAAIRRLDAGA